MARVNGSRPFAWHGRARSELTSGFRASWLEVFGTCHGQVDCRGRAEGACCSLTKPKARFRAGHVTRRVPAARPQLVDRFGFERSSRLVRTTTTTLRPSLELLSVRSVSDQLRPSDTRRRLPLRGRHGQRASIEGVDRLPPHRQSFPDLLLLAAAHVLEAAPWRRPLRLLCLRTGR